MPEKYSRFNAIKMLPRLIQIMAVLFGFMGLTDLGAQGVRLAWDPNPEPDIAGYVVHYGTESGNLTETEDVGKVTTAVLESLQPSTLYYFSVRAYNTAGQYSEFSDQISYITHDPPPNGLVFHDAVGKILPNPGFPFDLGTARLGAIGQKREFMLTNHGEDAFTGLRLSLEGHASANYMIEGIPSVAIVTTNGSFENGFEGWTASGSVRYREGSEATHGSMMVDFSAARTPNDGILSQTFPTIPGRNYVLKFDYGIVSFNSNPQRIRTTIQGKQILVPPDEASITGPGGGTTVWKERTLPFKADSNQTTITFEDVSSTTIGVDLTLDNVRVIDADALNGSPGISLAPRQSLTFTVIYKPTGDGSHTADLGLMSNDEIATPQLQLRGSASVTLDQWLATNNAHGGALEVPNGGTLNHLQMYAFGIEPGKATGGSVALGNGSENLRGTPAMRVIDARSNQVQGLFSRRMDHAMVGLRYTPQFSSDLIHWQNATGSQVSVSNDGVIEIVAVGAPAGIDGKPARFFRVGVSRQQPPNFGKWLANHNLSQLYGSSPEQGTRLLMDYAFGLDPGMATSGSVGEFQGLVASRGQPSVRPPGPGQNHLQGLFARRKNHAEAGLTYRPQFSTNLVEWHDADGPYDVIADDGEIQILAVNAPATLLGMPVRFFRVGIGWQAPRTLDEWLDHHGFAADPGQDQLLMAFAFGMPPGGTTSGSVAEAGGRVVARGLPSIRPPLTEHDTFQGLFGRRKDHAAAGLTYRPQFSADLVSWHDAESPHVVLAADGEIEVVSVNAPALLDGMPARFFRVGVSYNP